jgi:hypothetical protein
MGSEKIALWFSTLLSRETCDARGRSRSIARDAVAKTLIRASVQPLGIKRTGYICDYGRILRHCPGKRDGRMTELLVAIVKGCLEIFGYYTAKVFLPVFSLGRIHVAPAYVSRPFATSEEPLLKRLPNGTISIKHNTPAWWGC